MSYATEAGHQASSGYDQAAIRADLERTQTAFHALVDAISKERWRQKSPSCAWTTSEALVHLTWALEQLPKWLADPAS